MSLIKAEVRKTLRALKVYPKKRWSQSFLIDSAIRERLVDATGVRAGDSVLEIGAGTGILTERLAERGATVVAIEKDRAFARHLEERFAGNMRVRVVQADFLDCDLAELVSPAALAIGNLPYHITTPILFQLLKFRALFKSVWLTMQREVAERIAAQPGNKDYGVLTLSLGVWFEARTLFTIPARAFYPAPQVESAFVKLAPLPEPRVSQQDLDSFRLVVRTAFQHRRKRIDNALSGLFAPAFKKGDIQKFLQNLGMDSGKRPEELSLVEYSVLARAFKALS
ncbi:MAG: ribosomal RNA small subunit methyltransferase A [Candidatus Omnitrophica bacterium]|nr:ribosomal RNA small subunit methyltransferase A [Candidatus Omnitrophota bacterium]